MDFVVFGGSHASRKSRAMSHNSSVGEKKEGEKKMLLLTVIAGELGCLSVISYILSPSPPDPYNTANRSE